ATIHYTIDGSTPTASTGTIYSAPVNIAATTTLKAIASKSGLTDSTVTTGVYTIDAGSGGLPNGWTDADIGGPGLAGSATYSAPTFTVNGGGADIWGVTDQFNYAYQSTSSDLTITALVAS